VSKKGLKKQQKEAEKAAKKQEKQDRQHQEATSGAGGEDAGDDCAKGLYGALPMIQSKEKVDRTLVNLKELTVARADQKLWVRGRLHTSRAVGMCSLYLIYWGCFRVISRSTLPVDISNCPTVQYVIT
jgi:aspartyl-tRNA synthetase